MTLIYKVSIKNYYCLQKCFSRLEKIQNYPEFLFGPPPVLEFYAEIADDEGSSAYFFVLILVKGRLFSL